MSTRQKGKHLTFADRKYIEKMYKLKPQKEICEHLSLHPCTLERELMERLVKKKRPDIRVVLDLPEGEGSDWNDILRKRQEL